MHITRIPINCQPQTDP